MSALVEFLRARLDEDESQARAAVEEDDLTLRAFDSETKWGWEIASSHYLAEFYVGPQELAEHIARHDPARVLAEVESKRRVVDRYVQLTSYNLGETDEERARRKGYLHALEVVLEDHACVYHDHPDFNREWAAGRLT